MKKREIRKLASELYKEGKSRQETFDILIKKVKKPITYTADVLKYFPPLSTRKKFNSIYWLLFTLILISEILIIISELPFFHKSILIISKLLFFIGSMGSIAIKSIDLSNSPIVFNELGTLFTTIFCIPFLSWCSAILIIIVNHIKYNLNYLYLIIPYYIFSVFIMFVPFAKMIFGKPYTILLYGKQTSWGVDYFELEYKGVETYTYFSLYFLTITILFLCFILKKKMAPKYQKKQIAYLDKSGKKRMKLLIEFND